MPIVRAGSNIVLCSVSIAICKKSTERAGFDLPSLCKILNNLILQLNSNDSKDLKSLVDLLFLYDFLLSRDAFWGHFEGNFKGNFIYA